MALLVIVMVSVTDTIQEGAGHVAFPYGVSDDTIATDSGIEVNYYWG